MQTDAISGLCDHTFLLPTEAFRAPMVSAILARRRALDVFFYGNSSFTSLRSFACLLLMLL